MERNGWFKNMLRVVMGVIVAELVMVTLITIFQETLAGGVIIGKSSLMSLIIGGLGTLMAGFLAGGLSSLLAGNGARIAAGILSCLVVLETSYLIVADKLNNPVWFDVLAALSLIGVIWLGYLVFTKQFRFPGFRFSRPEE